MKKVVLVLTVVVVMFGLAGGLYAQDPQPRIVAKEVEHDFGKVTAGTHLSHVFEIANGGNAPLDIERVMPS
jgi:hypothetical protein